MKRRNDNESLLNDTRGAVIAEGVIVLPLFVITLACVIYFHGLYATKLKVSRDARACAWAYSISGCKKSALIKGCKATKMRGNYESIGDQMQDGNPFEVKEGGSSSQKDAQARSGLDKGLEGASSVGLALIGLEEGKTTSYAADVKRPSILGGGKTRVSGNYSVMCNEEDMDPIDVAKAALCALGKQLGFSGC